MDLYFVVILVLIFGICCNGSEYNFEQKFAIVNDDLSEVLTDEHVLVQLDTEKLISTGKMKLDCSDVIFLDDVHPDPIPFFMEGICNSKITNFWLRVPHIPIDEDKYINVRYGSSSSTAENGLLTFSGQYLIMHYDETCPDGFDSIDTSEPVFIRGINSSSTTSNSYEISYVPKSPHSHLVTDNLPFQDDTTYERLGSGTLESIQTHTHEITFQTTENSPFPPFIEVNFCIGENLFFTSNSIIPYTNLQDIEETSYISIHELLNSTQRLPISKSNGIGNIGGSFQHFHTTQQEITLRENPNTLWTNLNINGVSQTWHDVIDLHNHTILEINSSSNNHIRPFMEVYSGVVENIGNNIVQASNGMIIMSTIVPPLGYIEINDFGDKLLKFGKYGKKGGSLEHTHTLKDFQISSNHVIKHDTISYYEGGIGKGVEYDHKHSVFNYVVEFPMFPTTAVSVVKVFICERKKSLQINLNGNEIDLSTINNDINQMEYIWYIIGGLSISIVIVCIIIILCISIIIITLFLVKKFTKKNEEKIEMLITEGKEFVKPKVEVKTSLSVIPQKDFKLIKELGRGAEGAVYEIQWRNKKAAFKVFQTKFFDTTNDFQKFEAEAMVMSSVHHPNVISFYGISVEEPRIGIICELAEYGDLVNFITMRKGKLKNEDKFKLLEGITSGLEHLHSLNIIHRDIKAQNILIQKGPIAKLGDFGLSRICQEMNVNKTMRIGTKTYMAPEVCKGERYTEKVDIHSFGILMWEILYESFKPFGMYENVDVSSIEFKIASDPNFRPVIDGKIPKWCGEIMKECWKSESKLRPSAEHVRKIIMNKM